jgi:alkanesulfonate monooxygenase SsuD/methylene tetrahydromethanopterin reductase-like flavin-dependent oxidoreductase (luciferase family)
MRRHCRYLIVWAAMAMTMIDGPVSAASGDNPLPPDLKPMLAHAAIVAEMMHACGHTRTDLAARLADAWLGWWARNAKVQQTLAALRKRAAAVRSEERAPEISQLHISPAEAGEILAAYKSLRQLLRRQVEEQAQQGNMKFAGNCDDVLAKLTSGRLDYRRQEN